MDRAYASLEDAVATLFSTLAAPADAADACATCGGSLVPVAPVWRALQAFPVCARMVVTTWRRVAASRAPLPEASASKHKRYNAAVEQRVVSMARLCGVLYQCELLVGLRDDDNELVGMLVDAVDADDQSERAVLRQLLRQRTVARCVRLRLFEYALSTCGPVGGTWSRDVALALQDELRQASIEPIGQPNGLKSAANKSRKRGRGSMGKGSNAVDATMCERCSASGGSVRASGRVRKNQRERLIEALATWPPRSEVNESIAEATDGLVVVLNAPEVVRLLDRTNSELKATTAVNVIRPIRTVTSHKIRWEECDSKVDEVCGEVRIPMWRLVWMRERARMSNATLVGTLDEVVSVCAIADQFAYPTAHSAVCSTNAPTIGYRVVQAMILRTTKTLHPVTTLLRAVCIVAQRDAAAHTTTSKIALSSIRSTVIDYLRLFLERDETLEHVTTATSNGSAPRKRTTTKRETTPAHTSRNGTKTDNLLECLEFVHQIVTCSVEPHHQENYQSTLFALWFQLLFKCSREVHEQTSHWSLFLDTVAQLYEQLHSSRRFLKREFEAFVGEVMGSILVSNGTQICSSDGYPVTTIAIPPNETNRSLLRALLGLILSASSSAHLAASSINRLVTIVTRRREQSSTPPKQPKGGVFPPLLFPLLDMHLSISNTSSAAALSHLVKLITSKICTQIARPRLTRTLVELLFEWDSHCERQNINVTPMTSREGDHFREDMNGLSAIRELRLWKDLVRYFASRDVTKERAAFLKYTSQLLGSIDADSCPSELEGSLFSVLSQINSALTQPHVKPGQALVWHSDEDISRFIRAVDSPNVNCDWSEMLEGLKIAGKMEDMALSLQRWLGILTANPNALPAEMAAKLVMLANRLMYRAGSDLDTLKVLLVPVGGALQSALQFYSSPQNTSTSQVSVVRLSMMVRAYLTMNTTPDLVSLTEAFVDAALGCVTTSGPDGLLKLMQAFAGYIVEEVFADKLRDSLLLVRDRTSSHLVRNALATFAAVPDILPNRTTDFASVVFSMPVAERWLSVLLLLGTARESTLRTSALQAAECLQECLESLLNRDDSNNDSDHAQIVPTFFQWALTLDALLSTVLMTFALNNTAVGIVGRFRKIHKRVQSNLQDLKPVSTPESSGSLVLTVSVHRDSQQLQSNGTTSQTTYSSSLACTLRERVQRAKGEANQHFERTVDLVPTGVISSLNSVHGDGARRCYMPFSSWLTSVLMAQLHTALSSNEISDTWEIIFTDMVLQFYLAIQFHGDMDALSIEWLSTWIRQCLDTGCCIELLPFQRSLLLQHLVSTDPWRHLLHCARLLIADNVQHTDANQIMSHIVGSLSIMELSARSATSSKVVAMVDDILTMIEHVASVRGSADSPDQYLAIVSPLMETIVRASLVVSGSSTNKKLVVDAVKRIGFMIQQESVYSKSLLRWWSDLLVSWKRRLSHLNRRDAELIFEALETVARTFAGGDGDTEIKAE